MYPYVETRVIMERLVVCYMIFGMNKDVNECLTLMEKHRAQIVRIYILSIYEMH